MKLKISKIYLGAMLVLALALSLASSPQPILAATLCVDPDGAGGCFTTIQAAIDAAVAGDTIYVYPGTYNETAAGRTLLAGTAVAQGPHQFGLFFPNSKPGLSLVGVDGSGVPITDASSANLPYITTNATNNFGYSGIWVEADNVTVQGFQFGPNAAGQNKTFEVVADGFTLKYSNFSVPNGGAIYFGDWLYNAGTGISSIESYTIDSNVFDDGTLISVNSGAGYSGDNSGRLITNNVFAMGVANWPAISFTGSGTGVPWFVDPVGGAVITGNSFSGSTQYIRSRGTVDEADFDWASYWNDNTFDKKVMAGPNPPAEPRGYTYMSGSYSMPNTKRIGAVIQAEVDIAQTGDAVLVGAGIYDGTVNIDGRADLSIVGENAATTVIKPTATLGWSVGGYGTGRKTVLRVVNSTDISVSGLTFDLDSVKTNFVFAGLFWDATGSLTGNTFKNNSVLDTSGGYYEFGIAIRTASPTYTAASRAPITISGNTFGDIGRVSLLVHDFVDMTITGNTFYKTVDDFGYAIELGSESSGVISGNTIYGFDTPAASDDSNSAGIYVENAFTFAEVTGFTKNVTISGNEVYDSQWALYMGNEFDGLAGNVDINATVSANNFHDNVDGAILVTDEDKAAGSSVTANFVNNSLSNNGSTGYFIYTWGDGDIKVNINGDLINEHGTGVYMNDFATEATASTYNVVVNKSNIAGNTTYGVQNDFTGATVDATLNWWGSSLLADVTAEVRGNANYTPWLCSGTDTSGDPGFQPDVSALCSYHFTGFSQPIDMTAINIAKAGQTIPVQWRLIDANGLPVSDPSVFLGLKTNASSCSAADPVDAIETYSGSSGLQYLGDGYWQYNWKTPKNYAGKCRTMYVLFQGGQTSPTVTFQFK